MRAGNVLRRFAPQNAASAQRGTEFHWVPVPQTQLRYVREAKVTQQIFMKLGDHVDHLLVMVKLAFPEAVWSPGTAPAEFPVVEPSRVGLATHHARELLDRWWAGAPRVPEWWSEAEVNEAPAKCSWMTWAVAAPWQAPAPRKSVGNT